MPWGKPKGLPAWADTAWRVWDGLGKPPAFLLQCCGL